MNQRRALILIILAAGAAGIAAVLFLTLRSPVTGATLDETGEPQIAFMAYEKEKPGGELFVYDQATRRHIQITRTGNHVSWAAWSPNGQYLAFIQHPDMSIYRYDVTNGELLRLTPKGAPKCYVPAWSPDGSQLACSNAGASRPGVGEVFLVNADGSGVTTLTEGSRPSWSADGSRLIFVTRRDLDDPHSEVDIASVEIASGKVEFLAELEGVEYKPQWSPDGSLIAYVENNYHPTFDGLQTQTLKLWDGETVTVVAEDLWRARSDFDFSPDGGTLRYGNCRYDIQSAEETCSRRDPPLDEMDDSPVVYSPDEMDLADVRDGQLCVMPMGIYGCVAPPPGVIWLLGWRP